MYISGYSHKVVSSSFLKKNIGSHYPSYQAISEVFCFRQTMSKIENAAQTYQYGNSQSYGYILHFCLQLGKQTETELERGCQHCLLQGNYSEVTNDTEHNGRFDQKSFKNQKARPCTLIKISSKFYPDFILNQRWFSVEICKYKPGYKSHDL